MGSVQSYSTYGAPLASSQPTGSADFSQSGTATGADLLSKAFTGIQQFAGSVFTLRVSVLFWLCNLASTLGSC